MERKSRNNEFVPEKNGVFQGNNSKLTTAVTVSMAT